MGKKSIGLKNKITLLTPVHFLVKLCHENYLNAHCKQVQASASSEWTMLLIIFQNDNPVWLLWAMFIFVCY